MDGLEEAASRLHPLDPGSSAGQAAAAELPFVAKLRNAAGDVQIVKENVSNCSQILQSLRDVPLRDFGQDVKVERGHWSENVEKLAQEEFDTVVRNSSDEFMEFGEFARRLCVPEEDGFGILDRVLDVRWKNPLEDPSLDMPVTVRAREDRGKFMADSETNGTRNAHFYEEESIRASLLPLSDARAPLFRVPPGLEDFEEELRNLKDASSEIVDGCHPDPSLPDLREEAARDPESSITPMQRQRESAARQQRIIKAMDSLLVDSDDDDDGGESMSTFTTKTDGFANLADLNVTVTSEDLDDFEEDVNQNRQQNMMMEVLQDVADGANITLATSDEVDVANLEQELDEITKETARVVSTDLFVTMKSQSRATGQEETWVETTPIDTKHFHEIIPNPALTFSFELDDFQKQAIIHIERRESVFVAAHTSAGKTVCCEYAIALALRNRTKTIYTSPIKALSNQKFRDFCKKFGSENVGLITGDVTINGTASCLVVTTEILRSMLYRGADVVSEIETVIFDEIHYICDPERGVVYEETIIMLSTDITLVFLSATSPNSVEFAGWVGRTKRQKVHVVFTQKRPIPLEHWIWGPGQKNEEHFFKILDANKVFLKEGYAAAKRAIEQVDRAKELKKKEGTGSVVASKKQQKQREQKAPKPKGFNPNTERQHWLNFIHDLEEKELLPVVVFSFSKKKCDERAAWLNSLDMTRSKAEKSQIHVVFKQALSRLQGSDKELPQVIRIKELLLRGLGVHHGGLLPILKEVVEILFTRGLVKLLFATETFAIGVNMPARSVCFSGIRKHDGVQFRDLTPGEYTQMAGRAGRRGLDTVGTVLIFGAGRQLPTREDLSKMMTGTATRLSSQFRLTYAMILRLLRAAEISVAEMIKRSFSEFGSQKLIGGRDVVNMIAKGEGKLKELREKLELPCDEIQEYQQRVQAMQARIGPLIKALLEEQFGRKPARLILRKGRVVIVTKGSIAGCCAAMITNGPKGSSMSFDAVLLGASLPKDADSAIYHDEGSQITFHSESIKPRNIAFVSSTVVEPASPESFAEFVKATSSPSVLDPDRLVFGATIMSDVAPLDPVRDLKVGSLDFVQAWRECASVATSLPLSKCHGCKVLQENFIKQNKLTNLELNLRDARRAISDENLALFPDFQARLDVLERLAYISKGDRAVQLKGRVACEINTCDELILTEMVFQDIFGPLLPEECAAICSALVIQKKNDDTPTLTENLEHARDQMIEITEKLEALQKLHRVEMDPNFVEVNLNFGLMEAVFEWARGMPFRELTSYTSLEEGSIVRTVTRLDETCREVRNIAQLVGDAELFEKMKRASELIKRDIMFAGSLYVS